MKLFCISLLLLCLTPLLTVSIMLFLYFLLLLRVLHGMWRLELPHICAKFYVENRQTDQLSVTIIGFYHPSRGPRPVSQAIYTPPWVTGRFKLLWISLSDEAMFCFDHH
uniref:Uncharacterized protein n=1 Tax=Trichobilharzia regenti TaxID=157069 RepID=A0AA85KKL0_TRIRE|nr:unnamed protein product [Trichobilharzia regenti]